MKQSSTRKKYPMTQEERFKLQQALENFNRKQIHSEKVADEEDGEGGEGGDSGTAGGAGGVEVEKLFFVENFSLLRLGEKEFGPTNEFDVAAYLAKNTRSLRGEMGHESGLKAHPILSKLSKFDGDTPDMSTDPTLNDAAVDRYENTLQLQMQLQNKNQLSSRPELKPRGP